MHRVLIVDDHPLMRRGIAQLLALESDFDVVGEAENGAQAVELAKTLLPDLILLDMNMKGMDGRQTLIAFKQNRIPSHIVVLTVSDAYEDVISMLRQGATGYLLKDMDPDKMLESLRLAAHGEQVLSRAIANYLLQRPNQPSNGKEQKLASTTKREREILALVAEGKSNRDIAGLLFISEGTVKVHVKSMLKKLGFKSRVEAAVWYLS